MKIVLRIVLALGMMATSASTFAQQSCNSATVYQLREELHTVFAAQNTIFTYEGASSNPDPTANQEIAGIINAEIARIFAATTRFAEHLANLGVTPATLIQLRDRTNTFIEKGNEYSAIVNRQELIEEQRDSFNEFRASARALGTVFFEITGNPICVSILDGIAIRQGEMIQAYRGVLVDPSLGANPADPNSEGVKAVQLDQQIIDLSNLLAAILVQWGCR